MRLPFYITENNMGSQTHHFLRGIIKGCGYNDNYFFNNYICMTVKHYVESHGDFTDEGIYGFNNDMIRQFVIRGPVKDLKDLIIDSLNSGIYVVININEQMLPHRRAFENYYFRHDLIIYGYDDEKNKFITAGFDENMKFSEMQYSYDTVINAYKGMKYEWDYEVFLFKPDIKDVPLDKNKIMHDLQIYISGENPVSYLEDAFKASGNTSWFCNCSYKGFYGIDVYDYLVERIKGNYRLFGIVKPNNETGTNDLRTVNALTAHALITGEALKEAGYDDNGENRVLISKLKALHLMLMHYMDSQSLKNKNKFINMCRSVKDFELSYINKALSGI